MNERFGSIFVVQVFDGHGGPEAAAFMKKHAMRLFFEDFKLSNTSECDDQVDESLRRAFQAADLAIADDPTVHASSGTTALIALLLGRYTRIVLDCWIASFC